MNRLITFIFLITFTNLNAQVVLHETQSRSTLVFEPILLISVVIDPAVLSAPSPLSSGLPIQSPAISRALWLRFTLSPPASNLRTINVSQRSIGVEFDLELSLQSIPVVSGLQLSCPSPVKINSISKALVHSASGGCSGTGPNDGIHYTVSTDLSSSNYAALRSGNHQTILEWNAY